MDKIDELIKAAVDLYVREEDKQIKKEIEELKKTKGEDDDCC